MSTIEAGQRVQLKEQYKVYPAGYVLDVRLVRNVNGQTVTQCVDPTNAFEGVLGIPASKLVAIGAAPEAAPAPAEAAVQLPPFVEFLIPRTANMTHGVAEAFAEAYIGAHGGDDLNPLYELLEGRQIAQTVAWTPEQTAYLYLDLLDSLGCDADPAALAIINPQVAAPAPAPLPVPPPVAPVLTAPALVAPVPLPAPAPSALVVPAPVPTPAPAAEPAKKGARRGKAVDLSAVAVPTGNVDSEHLTAGRLNANLMAGELIKLWVNSPTHFAEDLQYALVILQRMIDTKPPTA